ncbi:MAG: 4'-phosphopantetheinyl transferase superfamily protein [Bacteroidota bacterium]|nr:4'-phosphopantetheinyl transferase superfamily protein [Bacteroidota bacterium]
MRLFLQLQNNSSKTKKTSNFILMPLFYQHNINDSTKLAVWHITEPEDFFLEKVIWQNGISHPHKRLQHLAGRYLLQLLHPGFPLHLIEISESRKPFLGNGAFHFSISHCGDYAAVIISDTTLVGIDVELITEKIELIKKKFLDEDEINLLSITDAQLSNAHTSLLTLLWSTKEAIFKWYGKGAVDFKKNMIIDRLFLENEQGHIEAHFIKDERIDLKINFQFFIFHALVLAWVVK